MIGSWRGVSGPPGLTAAQVAYWQQVLSRATQTDEWKADLGRLFWTPMYLDGDALRDHLARERIETRAILSELGLLSG